MKEKTARKKKILKRNKYQQEAREEETRNHEKKNSEDWAIEWKRENMRQNEKWTNHIKYNETV